MIREPKAFFPLALGKTFAWSKKNPCRQANADHQMVIKKFQNTFIRALQHAFIQAARRAEKTVTEQLIRQLQTLQNSLPRAAQNGNSW